MEAESHHGMFLGQLMGVKGGELLTPVRETCLCEKVCKGPRGMSLLSLEESKVKLESKCWKILV